MTPVGELLRRLPVSPRLARVLVARRRLAARRAPRARCSPSASHRRARSRRAPSDVIARADSTPPAPSRDPARGGGDREGARRVLDDRAFAAVVAEPRRGDDDETIVRRALLAGFPGPARARGAPRARRASCSPRGTAACSIARASCVDGEFLLALDVEAGARGPDGRSARAPRQPRRARLAPAVDALDRASVRSRDGNGARVGDRARRSSSRSPSARSLPTRRGALPLLVDAFVARGVTPDQAPIAARLRFAGIELDLARDRGRRPAPGRRALPAARDPRRRSGTQARRELDRLAPESLPLPSRPQRQARLPRRRHGRRFGEAPGAVRARGVAADRSARRRASSSSCSRRTGAPCRRRAIFGASGTRRTRSSGRSFGRATRGTLGRRIRGTLSRPIVRSRGGREDEHVLVGKLVPSLRELCQPASANSAATCVGGQLVRVGRSDGEVALLEIHDRDAAAGLQSGGELRRGSAGDRRCGARCRR